MPINGDGVLIPPPGVKGNAPMPKGKWSAFSFDDLPNPIPQEIADTDEIVKLHKDWKFVPYAGTVEYSGDSLRSFFESMVYLSPSHGACIQSKKLFSLGKMTVKRKKDPDFVFGIDEEVNPADGQRFVEFLKTIDTGGKSLKILAGEFHEDWEEAGDQFIEIVAATTLGVTQYSIHRHPPRNCKYLATGKDEQRFVAISPIWKDKYLRENPPDVLPIFPAVIEEGGTLRTLIHRKNGKNHWYGRPPAFASWVYQYREFQDSTYLVKVANNNFTGQLIVEVEDDDPEKTDEAAKQAGFVNEAHRIADNFTAQSSDPMTVWYTTRPTGSRPMFVHDVKPNTTQEFYKVMGEISERVIIRAHSWSKRLMEATETSGLSTNVFMDVLKSRLPVIYNVQENAVAILNQAIRAIAVLANQPDFQDKAITFISPYQEILEQMEEAGEDRKEPDTGKEMDDPVNEELENNAEE